jgi:hypothetical protein
LKIHISNRLESDFIAWHPDKRGMFSVKSAYQLALRENMQKHNHGATSARPGGERPSWKVIWQCKVPAKVKILAWRICRNVISTQANMARRRMATTDICRICGTRTEDSFHVFMRCPHARSLWLAMSEIWAMPNDTSIKNTGTEWLLSLLLSIPDEQRAPGVDPGPWQPGPRPGARRRCPSLTMHYSKVLRGIVAIITEGGPGCSEFLDPPLAGPDTNEYLEDLARS